MSALQRFNCEICGQEALTESDLRTHLLLEHEENAGSCPLCDLRHLTLEELNLHMNTAHSTVLSPQRTGLADSGSSSREITDRSEIITDYELKVRNCEANRNNEQWGLNLDEEYQLSESSFISGAGTVGAVLDRSEKVLIDSELKNKSSARSTRNDDIKETSRSCACSFGHSDSLATPGSPGFLATTEHMYINGCANIKRATSNSSDTSDNLENDCASSPTWLRDQRNASAILERKRTRSEAQLSSASARSSAVDVNSAVVESARRPSSSSLSSTASPFKKLLRIFSPNKSLDKLASKNVAKDAESAGELSSGRQLDGIWSEDQAAQIISDPECPFCDISGLDPEAMARHVEHEHADVLISPGPSKRPAQNECKWNTAMIQKSPASPKPTLLSLSKQARNLQAVVTCPICGLGSYDPDFLTVHINTEHLLPGDTRSDTAPNRRGATKASRHVEPQDHAGPSTSTSSDSKQSVCPVCGIAGLDTVTLNDHVESHFEVKGQESFSDDRQLARQLAAEERQLQDRRQRERFKQLQVQYGMDDAGSHKQQSEKDLETAVVRGEITVADYHQERGSLRRSLAVGVDDGKSCTSGLIQKMVTYYTDQTTQGLSYSRLCSETDHYSSTYGDKGWGCGYRNLQILLSSLVHVAEYRQVLFSGQNSIPSISKLQQLIEAAWAKGFDPQGREQLGGRVVNSRKWIGATEIVALLSSLRAKCRLVDFHTPNGSGGTHPAMFEWVRDYFGKPGATSLKLRLPGSNSIKKESIMTGKSPLYLQHEGHSRTIIGCEVHKDSSIRLLLFDPSYKVNDMQGLGLAKLDAYAMRPVRKSLTQMKAKQYQIVSVDRLMTSEQEYEQSKILHSERKP